jgi:hypothetical protein
MTKLYGVTPHWLQNNRSALNDPAGPGGRDAIIRVTGPTATTGSFGADDAACQLTLLHASGAQESGWLTLRPELSWNPNANPTTDRKSTP